MADFFSGGLDVAAIADREAAAAAQQPEYAAIAEREAAAAATIAAPAAPLSPAAEAQADKEAEWASVTERFKPPCHRIAAQTCGNPHQS